MVGVDALLLAGGGPGDASCSPSRCSARATPRPTASWRRWPARCCPRACAGPASPWSGRRRAPSRLLGSVLFGAALDRLRLTAALEAFAVAVVAGARAQRRPAARGPRRRGGRPCVTAAAWAFAALAGLCVLVVAVSVLRAVDGAREADAREAHARPDAVVGARRPRRPARRLPQPRPPPRRDLRARRDRAAGRALGPPPGAADLRPGRLRRRPRDLPAPAGHAGRRHRGRSSTPTGACGDRSDRRGSRAARASRRTAAWARSPPSSAGTPTAAPGTFSTATTLLDLAHGRTLGNLERFTIVRGGGPSRRATATSGA